MLWPCSRATMLPKEASAERRRRREPAEQRELPVGAADAVADVAAADVLASDSEEEAASEEDAGDATAVVVATFVLVAAVAE